MTTPTRVIAGATRHFSAAPSTDPLNFDHIWTPPDEAIMVSTVEGKKVELDHRPAAGSVWVPPKDVVKLNDRGSIRLDQGGTSACTRFAVGNASKAKGKRPTNQQCINGYRRAQQLDEIPGEEPTYYGSTGNGACKAAREEGVVTSWQYIPRDHPEHVIIAVLWGFDVMWACDVREGMASPNQGWMAPVGGRIGGHEMCWYGWIGPWNALGSDNSWSNRWGVDGQACMTWPNYRDVLWPEWAEAIVPQFT